MLLNPVSQAYPFRWYPRRASLRYPRKIVEIIIVELQPRYAILPFLSINSKRKIAQTAKPVDLSVF